MMNADELAKIHEEILFWETHMFSICILIKIPEFIPDNFNIKTMLAKFLNDRDYHAIMHRLNVLKKGLSKELFIAH